jgi:ribosomal protein S18 acetylase RimI-like enzyme
MELTLRPARADEAAMLGELALRAKAHWGYDESFLEACRADLTLRPADIAARRAVVAAAAGRVTGFYTLDGEPPEGELGNLWVEPAAMRHGIGRRLWRHAMARARELGFRAVLIDSDPHAEGFYLRMGAVRVGEVPSTAVAGRMLPRLRVPVSSGPEPPTRA